MPYAPLPSFCRMSYLRKRCLSAAAACTRTVSSASPAVLMRRGGRQQQHSGECAPISSVIATNWPRLAPSHGNHLRGRGDGCSVNEPRRARDGGRRTALRLREERASSLRCTPSGDARPNRLSESVLPSARVSPTAMTSFSLLIGLFLIFRIHALGPLHRADHRSLAAARRTSRCCRPGVEPAAQLSVSPLC